MKNKIKYCRCKTSLENKKTGLCSFCDLPMAKGKTEIKCRKCNYIWFTKSKMVLICCPSCATKNEIKK